MEFIYGDEERRISWRCIMKIGETLSPVIPIVRTLSSRLCRTEIALDEKIEL